MVILRRTGWKLVSAMPRNILQGLEVRVAWSVIGYGLKQYKLSLVAQQVTGGGHKAPLLFKPRDFHSSTT